MEVIYAAGLLIFSLCCNLGHTLLCNKTGTSLDWWCSVDNLPLGTLDSTIEADSCFCVQFKSQTQKEAFDSCEALGGFLTDIQNSDENNLIGQLLTNAIAENQTALTATATASANANAASGPCGKDAVSWNGTCYAYSGPTVTKTWPASEDFCRKTYIGGHLTSVKSVAEQNFMGNLTKNCSMCSEFGYFVGGNNYGNKTNWRWSDNNTWVYPKVTNNTAWAKQPEDPTNQQCVVLVPFDNGWGDWYCGWSLPYICSFPIPPVTVPAASTPIVTTMKSYTLPPTWIGLYLTVPGLMWSMSSNCSMTSATPYLNLNQTTQSLNLSGYVYGNNQKWANANASSKMTSSVCRKDRNICGRNLCPTCSSCTATNNGNCYKCFSL